MTKPEKKFLKLPHLDGGRELLRKFIRENLQYPEKALEKKIQGDVIIKYKVTGKGEVIDPEVVKGIGYGCDEEALRLVSMLSYQSVKNRGVRVITDNRIKIPFRLKRQEAQQQYAYTYVESKKKPAMQKGKEKHKQPDKSDKNTAKNVVYTYTVSI